MRVNSLNGTIYDSVIDIVRNTLQDEGYTNEEVIEALEMAENSEVSDLNEYFNFSYELYNNCVRLQETDPNGQYNEMVLEYMSDDINLHEAIENTRDALEIISEYLVEK